MRKYLLLFLLLPQLLCAQSKVDSLKFEMIKATVDFYATDTKAFPATTKNPSDCKGLGYDCLITFAKSNQLDGVNDRVNKWSKIECKDLKDLANLKRVIIKALLVRSYRDSLPGYKIYENKLLDLAAGLTTPEGPPVVVLKDDTTSKTKKVAATDSLKGAGTLLKNTTVPDNSSGNLKTWAPLIISLAALALSVLSLIIVRRKPKLSLTPAIAASRKDEENFKEIEERVDKLNARLQTKADVNEMNALSEQLNFIRKSMEEQTRPVEDKQTEIVAPIELKIDTPPESFMAFAKFPNQPEGFSDETLKKEQNGEQVYEIIITGDKATYAISTNSAAQDYALNDFNYILGKACTFKNQPFSGCRISTIQKGTLVKSTDGWVIESRAVIEFR